MSEDVSTLIPSFIEIKNYETILKDEEQEALPMTLGKLLCAIFLFPPFVFDVS